MKMIGNVCIFLTVALFVTAAVMIVITRWYINLCKQWNEEADRISQLEADNALLLDDKRGLIVSNEKLEAKNKELCEDNIRLTEAVKELRKINQELMNTMPTVTEPKEETTKLLPEGHTNTYRCEDYHLFNPKSEQANLQKWCFTDEKTGIRQCQEKNGVKYYCAAMAGAYGTDIGHAYRVKLKCGTEFNVILADFKHPIDNVRADDYGDADTNYDGQPCTCVIEFVVDMAAVPDKIKQAGTMSALAQFGGVYGDGGDIVEIKDLGKVW